MRSDFGGRVASPREVLATSVWVARFRVVQADGGGRRHHGWGACVVWVWRVRYENGGSDDVVERVWLEFGELAERM